MVKAITTDFMLSRVDCESPEARTPRAGCCAMRPSVLIRPRSPRRLASRLKCRRAHGEVFSAIRPAATMVEVRALIDPRLLVEVEATAIISTGAEPPASPTSAAPPVASPP